MMIRQRNSAASLICAFALSAGLCRADLINDLAFGDAAYALDFMGFDLIGRENPLTGGIDFAAVADFQGNTLDFGPTEVTLTGPISFDFSYGRRLLHTVDIGFTTALNSSSAAQPLTYNITQRFANQTSTASGSLLLDGDLSIDQLGFYDLNLRYSTRNDWSGDGPFGPQADTLDADLGPIHVTGNVFVDIAAVVFDPLLERAGRENFFDPFSGVKQLESQLTAADRVRAQGFAGAPDLQSLPAGRTAITPNPSTLVMLAAAMPFILLRRRRRLRERLELGATR